MNILVTGGCGFIGSHVVDALVARGDHVIVLDDLSSGTRANLNPKATLVEGDVADHAQVERLVAAADAVVHLAAIASVQVCEQEPERAAQVNVEGTLNIFRAAAAKYIPVVYASSAAVYGDNPNLPLTESVTPHPISTYGRHKRACEVAAAEYTARVPSAGLRFFNVYGPRQDPRSPYSGVISIFADRMSVGEPLILFGDGEQTRDFIYVGDVVALILRTLTITRDAHIFNGCTGRATSLIELASTLGEITGRPAQLQHATARPADIRHSLGAPDRAKVAFGFEATTTLLEGLSRLLHDS